uniref:Uncharacterized protein n=1 Tax=Solanum lycopersicum TaxID=4081 RepID=A0A3Q7HLW8_SOLLC
MVEPTESENHSKGQTYFLRPRYINKSKNKNEDKSDDEELDKEGSDYEECKFSYKEECDDRNEVIFLEEKEHIFIKENLFLVFRFEEEEPILAEKEEWEKESCS